MKPFNTEQKPNDTLLPKQPLTRQFIPLTDVSADALDRVSHCNTHMNEKGDVFCYQTQDGRWVPELRTETATDYPADQERRRQLVESLLYRGEACTLDGRQPADNKNQPAPHPAVQKISEQKTSEPYEGLNYFGKESRGAVGGLLNGF